MVAADVAAFGGTDIVDGADDAADDDDATDGGDATDIGCLDPPFLTSTPSNCIPNM